MAVLLTPKDLAASVKLIYSNSSLVSILITFTGIPDFNVLIKDNLVFVSIETILFLWAFDILSLIYSDKILPVAALDKFPLASLLSTLSLRKYSIVLLLCLKPANDPATLNILYSGL